MNTLIKIGIVTLSLAILSSCMPRNAQMILSGRSGDLIQEFEHKGGYAQYGTDEDSFFAIGAICEAYFSVRNYEAFQDCVRRRQQISIPASMKGNWNSNDDQSYFLGKQAIIEIELADYEKALDSAGKALELERRGVSDELGVYKHRLVAYQAAGIASALLGKPEQARRYAASIKKSMDANIGPDYSPLLQTHRHYEASIHMALGDYKNVLIAVQRTPTLNATDTALQAFETISSFGLNMLIKAAVTPLIANWESTDTFPINYMNAKANLETGKIDPSREALDNALRSSIAKSFGQIYPLILRDRAAIALIDDDKALAISLLSRAIEAVEAQRSTLKTETSRIGFVDDKQSIYADMVSALISTGRIKEALNYAERAKARALVEMLASRQNFATHDNDASSAGLIRQLDGLERQSIQLASAGGRNASTRNAKMDAMRSTLRSSAPELASLVTVGEIDIADIQARLTSDETLMEYFGHGNDLYVFVVTTTSLEAIKLDGERLADDVTALRRAVQEYPAKNYADATRRMYDRLIRPVSGKLTGKLLTIVPHGPLHYLPFAALNDKNQYLVDKYDLRLLPSASVLRFLNKRRRASQGLLAFGNPDLGDPKWDLPGAQAETQAINQGWKGSRILLRKLASEANFKKFAPQFKYLHLASHGQYNPDEPLKSRMMLAPGDGEDGNLTVDELYTLRLNADMVTLSACETGLGDIKSGDDVIGLTRGFLYAGAKSIVASLWPVSDNATAFLMKRFYAELKTNPKTTALRIALVDTKAKFPHPIFWSAFQLTGAVN